MTKFRLDSSVRINSIGIRIEDRELMIDFYRDLIGFSLITEENALAIMGTDGSSAERFYLEESPRAATHFGKTKKMQHFVINVQSMEELVAIVARLKRAEYKKFTTASSQVEKVATVLDPEGNTVVIKCLATKNNDLSTLEELSRDCLDLKTRLKADFSIEGLALNVLDIQQETTFLTKILGVFEAQPGTIELNLTDESIVGLPSHEVLGLEFIRLTISETNFLALEAHLVAESQNFFIDQKKRILTIDDALGIEWWFDRL